MKRYSFVVIGAGAAGLVVASGLARMKRRVLLIEKGPFGGDCTNVGCIPSKALIAAAEVAYGVSHAADLGIEGVTHPQACGALDYVRSVVESMRAKEEPVELKKIGVDTLVGAARFTSAHTIEVETDQGLVSVYAKKIVLATGSKPRIPAVDGLQGSPYLTNESIFNLETMPKSMAVIGGGAIGCELAQAFARLGTRVTLIHPHEQLLDKEDPLASQELRPVFEAEGIILKAPAKLQKVRYQSGHFHLSLDNSQVEVEQLLIATGRVPRIQGLDLEKAGVLYSERGVETDAYGRTSAPHIFAIGDVRGQAMFTHVAEREARAVLFNLLVSFIPWFFRKKLADEQHVPRVTFTSPEVASIGMSAQAAIEKYGEKSIAIYDVPFDEVDRAICQKRTAGFIRIVTKRWSSKILGATICSSRAGEMLMEIGMAMSEGIPLRKIAGLLHPYPIYNQAIRKAADQWLTKTIFGKK